MREKAKNVYRNQNKATKLIHLIFPFEESTIFTRRQRVYRHDASAKSPGLAGHERNSQSYPSVVASRRICVTFHFDILDR